MLKYLRSAFRSGHVDSDKPKSVKLDGFDALQLNTASLVRPTSLTYLLPLDDKWLTTVEKRITRSELANLRIGHDWLPEAGTELKTTSDDSWFDKDDIAALDAVCTTWCSDTYFSDAKSRISFVLNVTRLYDRLRELTTLRFRTVFKGGVMMRLVLLEYFNDFSIESRVKAIEYVKEAGGLTMSDFDFEIVPDNHDADESLIIKYVSLDFALLLWLKLQLANEVARRIRGDAVVNGLLNLGWNVDTQTEVLKLKLQHAIDTSAATSTMHGATVDRVVIGDTDPRPPAGYRTQSGRRTAKPRKNIVIFGDATARYCMDAQDYFREIGVCGVPASTEDRTFYATLNTYVGLDAPSVDATHRRGVFHLARIKHSFVVYITMADGSRRCERLGGEMVDMSVSCGVSVDEMRRHMYKNVASPYRDYPILGVDCRIAQLHSYTTAGFLQDLRLQLHHQDKPPWYGGSKTSKRIVRYVSFLVLHVLSAAVSGSYSKKVNALVEAVERTASRNALVKSCVSTGVREVNDFLQRERNTQLRSETSRSEEGRAYLRTVHTHLKNVVKFATTANDDAPLRLMVTLVGNLQTHYRK